jgi:hypothetical protein
VDRPNVLAPPQALKLVLGQGTGVGGRWVGMVGGVVFK